MKSRDEKPRTELRRVGKKRAAENEKNGVRQFSTIVPKPGAKLTRKAGAMGPLMQRVSGTTKSRKPVKARNPKRAAKEFARCYHSEARVVFVKSLACAASGFSGPIENAHVTDDGTKGAGRKSGYRCIAPLLGVLHRMLHRTPEKFRALYPTFDAERAAAATEAAWLAGERKT